MKKLCFGFSYCTFSTHVCFKLGAHAYDTRIMYLDECDRFSPPFWPEISTPWRVSKLNTAQFSERPWRGLPSGSYLSPEAGKVFFSLFSPPETPFSLFSKPLFSHPTWGVKKGFRGGGKMGKRGFRGKKTTVNRPLFFIWIIGPRKMMASPREPLRFYGRWRTRPLLCSSLACLRVIASAPTNFGISRAQRLLASTAVAQRAGSYRLRMFAVVSSGVCASSSGVGFVDIDGFIFHTVYRGVPDGVSYRMPPTEGFGFLALVPYIFPSPFLSPSFIPCIGAHIKSKTCRSDLRSTPGISGSGSTNTHSCLQRSLLW